MYVAAEKAMQDDFAATPEPKRYGRSGRSTSTRPSLWKSVGRASDPGYVDSQALAKLKLSATPADVVSRPLTRVA